MIYVVTRDPKAPLRVVQFCKREKNVATMRVDGRYFEVECTSRQASYEIEVGVAKMMTLDLPR